MKYALALTICLIPNAAGADTFNIPCGDYKEATDQLREKYHEEMIQGGVTTGGAGVVEIWAAPDGATWTIIAHAPDGKSCLLAAGTDWGAIRPQGESL